MVLKSDPFDLTKNIGVKIFPEEYVFNDLMRHVSLGALFFKASLKIIFFNKDYVYERILGTRINLRGVLGPRQACLKSKVINN